MTQHISGVWIHYHQSHWEMLVDSLSSTERPFLWLCIYLKNNQLHQWGTSKITQWYLQLLKSTGHFWTSNGYRTKSMSHLIIIVAPILKLIVLFSYKRRLDISSNNLRTFISRNCLKIQQGFWLINLIDWRELNCYLM